MSTSDISAELDSFREQWRAEVRAKIPGQKSEAQQSAAVASSSRRISRASEPLRKHVKEERHSQDDDEDYIQARSFDGPAPEPAASTSADTAGEDREAKGKEPVSALDHYEKAVEKEVMGNLGDSLRLYRKAFRVCPSPTMCALLFFNGN